ncbi:extracellular solute-binding protein [Paenibacillus rhizovicinus]|uniref:Extracellular solute-binding protein n=1 Tax=Paenibacillus rhizovicinus TaxID=2704463 RepID=A0A6C0P5K9_9BACL|nr:extracellular solute-binding protein [Paenibacillus rhizovicinus]QHW33586.1 extracellular solute-binding protein [Paenibacillus rhizovicinus]
MKRMTKMLSIAATTVVLASSLAACSSNNNGGNNSASSNETAATTDNSATNNNAAATDTSATLPTLKRLDVFQGEDYATYPAGKLLEEKTGYKMTYDMLPQDNPTQKLNLLMASGEPYDIVTTYNDMAMYSDYAKKGALTDLTPLIDQFGPNIKSAISQQSRDALKVDGKLYGIPNIITYPVGFGILIRTDWLDKVGMKMPASTDEFQAVLQAFKDKNPGGHGSQDVPFTLKGDLPMIDDLVGAFGMPNPWNDVNGQLTPRLLDPSFPDYVKYVSGLYAGGLLDKGFVVNKDATAKEKFSSGKAGAIVVHWADIPGISDALTKAAPDAKFAFVPALKGPNGKSGFGANKGFDRLSFVPKSAKNPEDAIKWINASLEPTTFKELAIGVEGTHYTVDNGAYMPILPIFNDERNLANDYMVGTDEANYPQYWQARVHKDPVMFEAFDTLNNKTADADKILNQLSVAPYLEAYSKNNQKLETMSGDYTVKLIAGAEKLDGLGDFQKKFNAEGGEASIKEVNAWYASK